MNKYFIKFLLLPILGLCPFIALASSIDFKQIKTESLTEKSQDWFMKEFSRGYMAVYATKTIFINHNQGQILLNANNKNEKEVWLLNTAKDVFQDYVSKPLNGYNALLIKYNNKSIGALLYHLLEQEKTIYLSQYFIDPNFQKQGIGKFVVLKILPTIHPDYKRYEVLARHQNDAAFLLYHNAGFSIGDVALVQKYNFDPLRYISFYKNF